MDNLAFSTKVLFFSFLLLLSSVASANDFFVNSTADAGDNNPGNNVCQAIGFPAGTCTLRAAIQEANALAGPDTIHVPPGTYLIQAPLGGMGGMGGGGAVAASPFTITTEMTIVGNPGAQATTIIAANNNRIRTFVINTASPVTISNLTIQDTGTARAVIGGGVLLSNSALEATFDHVTIRNSGANYGGGLAWTTPVTKVTITNSTIENNTGVNSVGVQSQGGGIFAGTGMLSITNSTIRNNTAVFGGGVYTTGDVTILNSTVNGNTATAGSTIANVDDGFGGGGIYVGSATTAANFTAVNSTISGNKALVSGAGLFVLNGSASLYNATISANQADSDNNGSGIGGGVSSSFVATLTPTLNIADSLIAGNISNRGGVDCESPAANLMINSAGYNLIGNTSDCSFDPMTDKTGTPAAPINAMLGDLANNGGDTLTHNLLSGSPATDGGNPSGCLDNNGIELTTDQRGVARPIAGGNAVCDIGAVEIATRANAGPDQVVLTGSDVTLDGSASSAVAGTIAYSWKQIPAATVTLSDATIPNPTFKAPDTAAVLEFELTITNDINGIITTDTDTVKITVNEPPVANAGPDQVVNFGDEVHLSGAASSDNDGTIIDYSWATTDPLVLIVKDATDPKAATFVAPDVAGDITIELTVTDNYGATATDIVVVKVNAPPVANAGPDQMVLVNDPVTLDGSASTDSDGNIVKYEWVQVDTGGDTVTLAVDTTNDPLGIKPTFTAPATEQVLTFNLTVTDDNGATSTDSVSIAVGNVNLPPPNAPPVANAGRNQAVEVGTPVTLDGSASSDSDGTIVSYVWEQPGGDPVTLVFDTTNDPLGIKPTFTAPDTNQTLTFKLTVTDDKGASSSDTVVIGVGVPVIGANIPPLADAGVNQTVDLGSLVTLDGSASYDPDGDGTPDSLTYSWVQTGGEAVKLDASGNASRPYFVAPISATVLTFELTVTDVYGASSGAAKVTITVGSTSNKGGGSPPANTFSSSGGGGGTMDFTVLLLALLGLLRVMRQRYSNGFRVTRPRLR